MAGWHYWLDGPKSQWTPGVGDGQGDLACCDSWGREESDTTERLIWSDPRHLESLLCFRHLFPKTCKFVVLYVPGAFHTSALMYQYWVHDLNTTSCKLFFSSGVSILVNDIAIHPFPGWNTFLLHLHPITKYCQLSQTFSNSDSSGHWNHHLYLSMSPLCVKPPLAP